MSKEIIGECKGCLYEGREHPSCKDCLRYPIDIRVDMYDNQTPRCMDCSKAIDNGKDCKYIDKDCECWANFNYEACDEYEKRTN